MDDVTALWNAAARRCAETPGLTLADIEDMIGPREDPSVEDCLTMLTLPSSIAGCHMVDFGLRPLTSIDTVTSIAERRSS
ncbi:hypothetical protein [Sphingomonas sp. DBB INV C78]|uniref:hypothetical protein n=1 Tax=Sphingomonas sp. DBB INV C78 TaxID=3349434 RepID=UPI0036D2C1E7